MEIKFFTGQSSLTLSILTLPGTPVSKPAQGVAAFLTHPGLLAKCTEKQKIRLEGHCRRVVATRFTNMMELPPRAVADDG